MLEEYQKEILKVVFLKELLLEFLKESKEEFLNEYQKDFLKKFSKEIPGDLFLSADNSKFQEIPKEISRGISEKKPWINFILRTYLVEFL